MPSTRFLFGYIFIGGVFLLYLYLGNIFGALWFLFSLCMYSIISYGIHKIWKYFRKDQALSFTDFFKLFLYKVSLYASIVGVVLGSFMYYQNSIAPAMMPQYTLSNGTQTIIFQTMSHIGSKEFYTGVEQDIRGAKQNGTVLYYEGVKPGTQKNSEEFNQALGINFNAELYDNFSKLYGVIAQNNADFLNIENNLDYNIDINIDEIMDIYRDKTQATQRESEPSFLQSGEVQDVNTLIIEQLSELKPKQLAILRYINQSLLNFMIKQEDLRNIIVEKVANQDLFSVILDERNIHIANEIEQRGDEKIFIIYGLMHFSGVLELLEQSDPNWKITNTTYKQLIIPAQ